MDFQQYVFSSPYFGWLCRGILFTLLITVLTTLISTLLGAFISILRTNTNPWIRLAGSIYINLFRNIPPVPLLLFLVFGLPNIFPSISGRFFPMGMEFPILIAGLSLNTSAYIAEILRSGLRAIPQIHYDTAKILGLGPIAIRVRVIYPQALRIALPALGTRLIHNMKNSSVALVLPLPVNSMEVLGQTGRIAGQTFAWAEPLIFAAAVYLSFAIILSIFLNRMARNAQKKIEIIQ